MNDNRAQVARFRKKAEQPLRELTHVISAGDEFTFKGVAWVVVAVNPGKGRASIEPKRGVVRTRVGGPVCVEQEVRRP